MALPVPLYIKKTVRPARSLKVWHCWVTLPAFASTDFQIHCTLRLAKRDVWSAVPYCCTMARTLGGLPSYTPAPVFSMYVKYLLVISLLVAVLEGEACSMLCTYSVKIWRHTLMDYMLKCFFFVFVGINNELMLKCIWVPLENLIHFQVVNEFHAFYGTRRYITVFTRSRHLLLFWAI
jgi:hypothetical protein